MQNACNAMKTMFVTPSARPEIDIHSLDYNVEIPKARPIVREGDVASETVMPTKPALTQDASSPQGLRTAPSYKTASPPPAQNRQQSATASKTTAAISTQPAIPYNAETFVKAAESGDLASVVRHIDAGLEVNAGPKLYGATPLMLAANQGHEAIVRQLLKAGAYVNQARTDGATAIMHAAQCGHAATVQALLDEGATVDQAMNEGRTALTYAAANGHTTIVQALLGKGASVDHARHDGVTALMLAAQQGCTATVQLLLEAGANCKREDNRGNTALSVAIHRKHEDVIKLLRAREAGTSLQRTGFF